MRMGSFEVNQPLPELRTPHVIAMLKPWLDAGSVGTLVLQRLETRFGARELARLARPGSFFDFTRYRPIIYNQDGARRLSIPNTSITFARTDNMANDFIFLHLLEPHMFGEVYAELVWQFLKKMQIQRYCLIGSFYDMVPHTRPILISGGVSGQHPQVNLRSLGAQQSNYEGPTTICNLISQEAEKAGVETLTLLGHLPNYTEIDEDFIGMMALLQVLQSVYNIPLNEADVLAKDAQLKAVNAAVSQDDKVKSLVSQLESEYDSRVEAQQGEQEINLSPEISQFLKEMEKRFKES